MEESKTLEERLLDLQAELKAPKNQYNKFGGYSYRSSEDIVEAVKPLAKKYGLLLTLSDDIVVFGGRIYVKATAMVSDIKNPEKSKQSTAFAREPDTKKGMDESQITGAASSYARKYALNGLFAIDDTKDADTLPPQEKNDDELKSLKKKIIDICSSVGGQKNEELMTTLKKFTKNGNPNALKEVETAKKCLAAVKKVKPVTEEIYE